MNNQNRSKIIHQTPILTAAAYRAKLGQKNSQPTPEQIQSSLLYYEKNLRIAQASIKLMKIKMEKARIRQAFNLINNFQRLQLNEDQKTYFNNKIFQDTKLQEQLCYLIQEKIENEQNESTLFMEDIKEIYYQEEQQLLQKTFNLGFKLHNIANKQLFGAFNLLKQNRKVPIKNNQKILILKRTLIKNMVSTINNIIIKEKQMMFHKLQEVSLKIKQKQQQKISLGLKQKGKKLLQLSYYPQFKVKSVLWRWYLNTSEKGTQIFVKAANKLVLYTNVNKITAFYRLMTQVKENKARIPPRIKRMATIVHVYSKLLFQRAKRSAFDQIKLVIQKKKMIFGEKILRAAQMRTRSALSIWYKQCNKKQIVIIKQKQKTQSEMQLEKVKKKRQITLKQIIDRSIKRKRSAIQLWRDSKNTKQIRENLMKRILNKIMYTNIGRIKQFIQKLKTIPDKKSRRQWDLKANKFQKGLATFALKALRKCFESFKDEYIHGRIIKSRGVIQIINCTKSKKQKMYIRWLDLIISKKLIDKCKKSSLLFQKINKSIKSVADNVFISNNQTKLKEKMLIKLFASYRSVLRDSFIRWRHVNRIEKIKDKITKEQRSFVVKLLENLLHYNKQYNIRQVIAKFKTNWKVTNYQKSFLKRMLQSKVGMTAIALRTIRNLPQRPDNSQYVIANIFERGLSRFVNRMLRESYESFKCQYEKAQSLKKRAVIQMISCTISQRKKIYNHWKYITEQQKILNKSKTIWSCFSNINLSIKYVADKAFRQLQYDDTLERQKLVVIKLVAHIQQNLRDTFARWRQLNRLERLREANGKQKDKFIIKLFENLLQQNMQQRVRKAISQFRINWRVIQIQKNFMKKLLASKGGMTDLAFRLIRCLPQKPNNRRYVPANIFERGLSRFVYRILRESYDSFKNQYEQAQSLKKRAMIHMISCTKNRRNKIYNLWLNLSNKRGQIQKTKRVRQIMQKTNFCFKNITDLAFSVQNKKKSQKLKHLQRLLLKLPNQLKQTFKIWRQNNSRLKIMQIFKSSTHILSRNNLQQILSSLTYNNIKIPKMNHKKYGLNEVQYIIKYILRLLSNRKEQLRQAIKRIKQIPEPTTRVNPWFKRSVEILCLNTRINVQKSFWRMIYNSQSSGVTFNAAVIVKMKKMYNNIKKTYILNLYHAFLMIDRKANISQRQLELDYYDGDDDQYEYNGSIRSPKYESFQQVQNRSRSYNSRIAYHRRQKLSIQTQQMILPQLNAQITSQNCRKVSVRFMGRLFNKFLKRRLKTWADIANPINKYNKILGSDSEQSLQIARLGAMQAVSKISRKLVLLTKQKSFDSIIRNSFESQYIYQREQSVGQISDFVQRHQLLLQQIKHYKQEYESACNELEQKDKALRQADNMITVLSLRNNYIITHKFIISLEQVFNSVLERNFDQAFDAIMQQANRNFQRTVLSQQR